MATTSDYIRELVCQFHRSMAGTRLNLDGLKNILGGAAVSGMRRVVSGHVLPGTFVNMGDTSCTVIRQVHVLLNRRPVTEIRQFGKLRGGSALVRSLDEKFVTGDVSMRGKFWLQRHTGFKPPKNQRMGGNRINSGKVFSVSSR